MAAPAPRTSSASTGPHKEASAGTIERVTFHSPETDFYVVKVVSAR